MNMSRTLTVEEVAERLRVKPITVREYLRKGKIPGRKIGKSWLIVEVDVEQFLGTPPQHEGGQAEMSAQEKWRALSLEEKRRRISRVRGMLAGGKRTLDDFMREKHEEVEEEERRWDERHKSAKTSSKGKGAA
jgi:excisionase family DNA binding protein